MSHKLKRRMNEPQASSHNDKAETEGNNPDKQNLIQQSNAAPNDQPTTAPKTATEQQFGPSAWSKIPEAMLECLRHYRDTPREKSKRAEIAIVILTLATAVAAFWSAWIFQGQLTESSESFRIDERAWIELEPIKPAQLFSPATNFIPRNSFTYELYPKNFGKTIARDVAMKAGVSGGSEDFGDSADQMARWQDKFLLNQFTEMGTGKPVVVPPSPIPKVLAPGVSTPVPYVVHAQSPQYSNNGHAMYDYVVGRVDYTDQFNVPHWIKFCFFVRNPRGELTSCQYGNDEDRNPETPKKAN